MDRQEFLGREGDLSDPAALRTMGPRTRNPTGSRGLRGLSGAPRYRRGGHGEVVFVLGQGRDRAHAEELVRRWQQPDRVEHALRGLNEHWDQAARRGPGAHTRPRLRPAAEPVAPLSDARFAHPGARRFLSGRRRNRLPRPAAGCARGSLVRPGPNSRAYSGVRRAAVRGRRRSPLVASAQ